jgi:hypothetical protein
MNKKDIHEGWTVEEWNETKKILDKILENLYNEVQKER